MIAKSAHVVVIGGGAVGCAAAFTLARSGVRVTLVEPDPFGAHASGKNPGNLNPILNAPPSLVPFALESFRRHLALVDELSRLGCRRYAMEPVQRILLAFDASEERRLLEVTRAFEGQNGFSARPVEPKALRTLEPRLSGDVRSGLLVLGNMSVDARALTGALADGAMRLGAAFVRGRVRDLDTAAGKVTGLRIDGGAVPCDAVVLATGPWVDEPRRWLGFSLPIEPVKGQMLRMRLPGEGLRHDLSHGDIALYRRGDGEIWVGVTKEPGHLDEMPTEDGRAQLMAGAARLLPAMERARLLEHCAAARPQGPAGLPIVCNAPGWDNVLVANGGGIKGILLCTGMAQAVCDLLLLGHTEMPVACRAA